METSVLLYEKSLAISTSGICVGSSLDRGRGVFATKDYDFDDIIEICPIIIFDNNQIDHLDKTEFYNYYFAWNPEKKQAAVALGYGSLYNHSYNPNAVYKKDYESDTIVIMCYKPIRKGEEITINYNCDPLCKDNLWFKVIE